ncbi:MAG: hypothetical protein F6K31_11185 [Symploca sp. SIO2G7]|nr:hypothetical protein [Symploca sp. SIO2G7]
MFEKILPLIIIFLIGLLLRKLKVLELKDSQVIGKLLANLVLPAIVFKSLYTAQIEADLIYLPVAGLFVVLSLTLIIAFVLRFFKLERIRKGALLITFPSWEAGAIGYTFMLLAFGELGLSRIVLFDLAQVIFLFTVIYFIACQFGQTQFKLKDGILAFLKTPVIWAIILALVLKLFKFNDSLLLSSLAPLENSFFFLILILLSLKFNFQLSSLKLCLIVTLAKTFCGLGLGWLAAMMFGFTGLERTAIIVGSSLPPSMLTLIFSEKNNLDTKLVANLLSISLPFSCVFMTVFLRLFLTN